MSQNSKPFECRVIFTLTSARSGTVYLRNLFANNVADCATRHEPFFDLGNPTMLGPAIYAAQAGRLERIRELLDKKKRYIERLGTCAYLESSHAFLKSAYRVALETFPDLQLIHLIRDPLKVAKSEAYRENWRRRVHAPFHYYLGDDHRRHFYWALTGNEDIYKSFDVEGLSLFQWYLVQWIEIENRAMSFLKSHQLHDRCFTLRLPKDLNDPFVIDEMFKFFGLKKLQPGLVLNGRKNRSLGYHNSITIIDRRQAQEVFERLPPKYLDIFQHEPYRRLDWMPAALLQESRSSGGITLKRL